MRILACADVHGKYDVYQWLLEVGSQHMVNAIVLAGDLLGCLDGFESVETAQRHEADSLVRLLREAATPVLYVMGNDDLIELPSVPGAVESVHGRRVEQCEYAFVGYQYSKPFMGGVFEKPDEEIRQELKELRALMDSRTVFVTHSPAHGILDPGIGDVPIGSEAITDFLKELPYLIHVHGHSHSGFGRMDRHFNVAAAARCRATIIDLSTLTYRVLQGDVASTKPSANTAQSVQTIPIRGSREIRVIKPVE